MKRFIIFLICIFSVHTLSLADGGHKTREAAAPYPTIKLDIQKDAKSGYNLIIITENFKFTPLDVNGKHVDNQGHAHVYINGDKIRHYSPYLHITPKQLRKGKNNIRVTLNANDHSDYTAKGKAVAATEIILQ